MSDDRRQPGLDDDLLDALLREAKWPEPSEKSEGRLRAYWFSLKQPVLPRRWLIAAAVLLAAGTWLAIYVAQWRSGVIPTVARKDVVFPTEARLPIPPRRQTPEITSRPPTRIELAMLVAAEKEAQRNVPRPPARPVDDRVARALDMLSKDASPAGLAAAENLVTTFDARAELLDKIRTGNESQRQAAARLFASVATPDAIPVLMELDRIPELRDAAVAGLARVAPPDLLASLARRHTSPGQVRTLIAALLREPSGQGVRDYLELVVDSQTRSAALDALDDVAVPPTDAFFVALDDPHVSVRNAAARVLGHIDGPQTTARLIAMAEQPRSRREALIALADSRGLEARRFLREVSVAGPLAGVARSILLQHASPD